MIWILSTQINNDTLANKNATEVDEDIQNEDSNENYEDDFEVRLKLQTTLQISVYG